MLELVRYMTEALVENKEAVEITLEKKDRVNVINIKVADDEIGKIIGKQGKVATAMRTIVRSVSPVGEKYALNIVE